MKRKLTIPNVLVLGFYLFYALSPLLYSIESVQAEEQAGSLQDFSITATQPFFADHSLLWASPGQDDDASSAPSSHVLLKKKRAVPASFKNIVAKLSLLFAKFFEFTPSSEIVITAALNPDNRPTCPHGFQLLHSGISPPSA